MFSVRGGGEIEVRVGVCVTSFPCLHSFSRRLCFGGRVRVGIDAFFVLFRIGWDVGTELNGHIRFMRKLSAAILTFPGIKPCWLLEVALELLLHTSGSSWSRVACSSYVVGGK